ncbi:MAG: substrate-binding domain-containing protein [Bellilinea sp.]
MSRVFILTLVAGLITGCTIQPSADPAPTPMAVRVEITSSLEWLRPDLAECAQQTPGLTLSVRFNEVEAQSLEDSDVLLRWSNLAPASVAPFEIGKDSLAVIVNPDNPVDTLDASQLKDFYTGQAAVWTDPEGTPLGSVQTWVYPAGEDTQILLTTTLLADSPIATTARIAPNPAAMLEAVAADPLAIGFLPARWLDSTVRQISITGYASDQWTLPILAVTQSEPSGIARDWLLCVQDQIEP